MAEVRTVSLGLAKVEFGEVDPTGGMQSTLTQMGYTYKDSFTQNVADPDITEYKVEEVDTPLEVEGELGEVSFEWEILNPNVTEMAATAGGTATAADNKWQSPKAWSAVEKAFKFTPKKGYAISVPRASVIAYTVGGFKKGDPMRWHIKATVLQIDVTSGSGTAESPMVLEKV